MKVVINQVPSLEKIDYTMTKTNHLQKKFRFMELINQPNL